MPEPFCAFDTGAYFIFIAIAPRELVFSMRIIQAVFAVAIFFFVGVGDIKHLLSWTQLFNKDFLKETKKRRFFERKVLGKPPQNGRSPVRFRTEGRNGQNISFYFHCFLSMKKPRNPLWNRGFGLIYLFRGLYMAVMVLKDDFDRSRQTGIYQISL